ncbi:MAG: hypothetical protein OXR66_02950 [Candidatus Woesearchaeota archaeon]|nr:hypothetical protein [Candidatus Woesearchaeota archaeon]
MLRRWLLAAAATLALTAGVTKAQTLDEILDTYAPNMKPHVESAMEAAGDNADELERAMKEAHRRYKNDPEWIAHMAYTVQATELRRHEVRDNSDNYLMPPERTEIDAQHITADFLLRNLELARKAVRKFAIAEDFHEFSRATDNFRSFREQVLPYKVGVAPLHITVGERELDVPFRELLFNRKLFNEFQDAANLRMEYKELRQRLKGLNRAYKRARRQQNVAGLIAAREGYFHLFDKAVLITKGGEPKFTYNLTGPKERDSALVTMIGDDRCTLADNRAREIFPSIGFGFTSNRIVHPAAGDDHERIVSVQQVLGIEGEPYTMIRTACFGPDRPENEKVVGLYVLEGAWGARDGYGLELQGEQLFHRPHTFTQAKKARIATARFVDAPTADLSIPYDGGGIMYFSTANEFGYVFSGTPEDPQLHHLAANLATRIKDGVATFPEIAQLGAIVFPHVSENVDGSWSNDFIEPFIWDTTGKEYLATPRGQSAEVTIGKIEFLGDKLYNPDAANRTLGLDQATLYDVVHFDHRRDNPWVNTGIRVRPAADGSVTLPMEEGVIYQLQTGGRPSTRPLVLKDGAVRGY